jgi:hypothetical protein
VAAVTPPPSSTPKLYSAASQILIKPGVTVEVVGPPQTVGAFKNRLPARVPAGAPVTRFRWMRYTPPAPGQTVGSITLEGETPSTLTTEESQDIFWIDRDQLAVVTAPVVVATTPRGTGWVWIAALGTATVVGAALAVAATSKERPSPRPAWSS